MTDTSTRPNRRTVKPGGRKTANRFSKLAGGDVSPDVDLSPDADDTSTDGTGLIGGMSAVAASEAYRVVNLAVAEIAPHPFNDDARSQPQPEDPKWTELLNGVRANGVRLPVLVVPRDAFAKARQAAAEEISPEARYVLIYGHRRRAAALEAGRDTVPAVIDDAIMDNDGDLDAMAAENLGRQDLSDLAEADLFARYADMGLTQRAIAERLGVDQATVSRRLALLLLTSEIRTAVSEGRLAGTEAAAIASELPYGPLRRWQKRKDPAQDSEQRQAEQLEALRLVQERKWTAANAAKRVVAERDARAEAAALNLELLDDPETEFGPDFATRRISRDQFTPGADVVGAINPNTGTLDLYTRTAASPADPPPAPAAPPAKPGKQEPPPATGGGETTEDADDTADDEGEGPSDSGIGDVDDSAIAEQRAADAAAAAASQARRREACAALITHQPTNADLLKLLVRQILSGVAVRSRTSAVRALLRDWDATADGVGEKARNTRAWHLAVASAELHTAELAGDTLDDDAIAHLDMLIERVGYRPSEWENHQLALARA